jgi:sugar lactone lactonase YvrE
MKQIPWMMLLSSLLLGGCSTPLMLPLEPQPMEGTFTTQALTENYLERKIRHWLANANGPALAREIEFARLKHPGLMETIMWADPGLYAQVADIPAVQSQRSDASFDAFMVRLSGVVPVLNYQIEAVNAGTLSFPYDLGFDSANNLYIVEMANNRVRKVTPAGDVSTIGVSTGFNSPQGLAVDAQGNVFVADTNNHRIRKITSQGIVTTVAGRGAAGSGGDGGSATDAWLHTPRDVAVDSVGNLYITDTNGHRIRKVLASNGTMMTIAGIGSASFSGDGSAATEAGINSPSNIVVDAENNVFFTDAGNYRIRKITAAGLISTVAGSGSYIHSGVDGSSALQAGLRGPYALAVDATGNLFVSTQMTNGHFIRQVTPDGKIRTLAGQGAFGSTGDGGPALSARLDAVFGLTIHPTTQEVFIADTGNQRIRKLVPQY